MLIGTNSRTVVRRVITVLLCTHSITSGIELVVGALAKPVDAIPGAGPFSVAVEPDQL
jgi:hypothetical protein